MARIKTLLGEGVHLVIAGSTIGGVTALEAPGWSKSKIEDTDLDNASVVTYVLSALKEFSDITISVKLNGASQIPETESQFNIVFGTAGTFSFYGQVSAVSNPRVEPKAGITRDITVAVTGLNASGEETAPTDPFAHQ